MEIIRANVRVGQENDSGKNHVSEGKKEESGTDASKPGEEEPGCVGSCKEKKERVTKRKKIQRVLSLAATFRYINERALVKRRKGSAEKRRGGRKNCGPAVRTRSRRGGSKGKGEGGRV